MSAGDALRVLVVDDDQDTIDSLAMLLRHWGHDVQVSRGGEAALRQAEILRPQLLLVDLAMPGMDGLQFARHLRSLPAFSKTPLIAVTGLSDPTHRQHAAEAGFDDFVVKPYTMTRLLEVLARVQLSVSLATEAGAPETPAIGEAAAADAHAAQI
jgi:CheY-like chemotaxis protein